MTPVALKAHLKSLLEVPHHTLAHHPGDLTDFMSNIVLKLLNSLGSVDIQSIFQIPPEKEVWWVYIWGVGRPLVGRFVGDDAVTILRVT